MIPCKCGSFLCGIWGFLQLLNQNTDNMGYWIETESVLRGIQF